MTTKKRWDELLNPERFRSKANFLRHPLDRRNEFENDFFRLVLSSSFRRLQDKTQVFPLQTTDFIRTRLTHSMEVSAIGRSIGRTIEEQLIDTKKLSENNRYSISVILASAGLVHDIGNPPFGHFGETAIKDFFNNYFCSIQKIPEQQQSPSQKDIIRFNDQQINDFTEFDGNVQGFRILRKLQYFGDEFSFNLSYPTLASIIKYPKNSIVGNQKTKGVSFKKFGYFISEEKDYQAINDKLNLNNERHPIAFLLESADDIAYSVADIEDGFKKGLISISIFMKYIHDCFESVKPNKHEKKLLKEFDDICKKVDKTYPSYEDIIIQKFKVAIQAFLITSSIECFLQNNDAILAGDYDEELLAFPKCKRIKTCLDKMVKERILTSKEILSLELVGHKVITTLLRYFTDAILSNDFTNDKSKNGKLYKFISVNFRHIFNTYSKSTTYDKLRLVTDFISGMTDSYALDVYQKLRAIKL
jgi:dGTPase